MFVDSIQTANGSIIFFHLLACIFLCCADAAINGRSGEQSCNICAFLSSTFNLI